MLWEVALLWNIKSFGFSDNLEGYLQTNHLSLEF